MKTKTGVEVQLYSILKLGIRWGLLLKSAPGRLYPRLRDMLRISQEAGRALGQVWRGAGNPTQPEFHSPNFQPVARHYSLSYPGPRFKILQMQHNVLEILKNIKAWTELKMYSSNPCRKTEGTEIRCYFNLNFSETLLDFCVPQGTALYRDE